MSFTQSSYLSRHNKCAAHSERKKMQNADLSSSQISYEDIKEEIKKEESDEESILQETRNDLVYEIIKEEIKEEEIDDTYSPIDYNTEINVKQEIKEEVKELDEEERAEDYNLDDEHNVDCSEHVLVLMSLSK